MKKHPQIQFESAKDIKTFQENRLNEELLYLSEKSPFYKKMFAEHKIDVSKIKTIEDLQHIPFTTKSDLYDNNKDFFCVPSSSIIDYATTSGTMGEPVVSVLTHEDLDRMAYNEGLSFSVAGFTENDILQLMTTIDRQFIAGLAYFFGAREIGMGIARVGSGIPELQWDTVKRLNPTCAVVVPSFLIKLIDFAEVNGINYNDCSIKKAICIGEPLRNNDFTQNKLATRINSKWKNLSLFSTYASTEMQTAFTECQHKVGTHHQPELVIIEFVDENNKPAKEGEAGELVITTIGIRGMPLLRYKTGDIVHHYTQPCLCGRNTIRLGPIVGRKGQMIKYKGTTLFPPVLYDILDHIVEVENYIIEVYTNEIGTDEIIVRIELKEESEFVVKKIQNIFRSKIRVTPVIKVESKETIHLIHTSNPKSRKIKKFYDLR